MQVGLGSWLVIRDPCSPPGAYVPLVGELFCGITGGEKHPAVGMKTHSTEVLTEVSFSPDWGSAMAMVPLLSESRVWPQGEEDEWKAKRASAFCLGPQGSCANLTWKSKHFTSLLKNNSTELNHKQSHKEKAGIMKGNEPITKPRYSHDIEEVVFSANKLSNPSSHLPLWK